MRSMSFIVSVVSLVSVYADDIKAPNRISFNVEKREFLSVFGLYVGVFGSCCERLLLAKLGLPN